MKSSIHIASFLVGVLMAVGLGVAGMTQPHKVIGFLDFFGRWEPDLMFVMGGAVLATFVLFRLALSRRAPLLAPRFLVPTRRDIDGRLLGGAALFGIGWGLTGICPGPALASTATAAPEVLVYIGGMTAGMVLVGKYDQMMLWLRARQNGQQDGQTPALSSK